MKTRKEYDSIGGINVPVDKYWGASTQRSKKYFDIGEFKVRPILIKSIAIIKKTAAIVHKKEKQIDPKISNAIIKACNDVIEGKLNEHFPFEALVRIVNMNVKKPVHPMIMSINLNPPMMFSNAMHIAIALKLETNYCPHLIA